MLNREINGDALTNDSSGIGADGMDITDESLGLVSG
jgi:hypothetical protein